MSDSDRDDEVSRLRERVDRLESQLDTAPVEPDTEAADGWRVRELLSLGLTRREALLAASAIAGGLALPNAITYAVGTASAQADVRQVGTPDLPVDVYGRDGEFNTLSTGELITDQGLTVEEDDNSPLTISGASSGTITLAGTYDVVKCIVVAANGAPTLEMRVNGDTGSNYNTGDESGTKTTGATEVGPVGNVQRMVGTVITMSGSWSGGWGCRVGLQEPTTWTVSATNANVTSPLDSITFLDTGASNFDLTVRVLGVTG